MTEKKKCLVVKANALVEASYRLSLAEQRIILLAITEERDNRLSGYDGILTVTAEDYATVYGVAKNTAYEEIKDAINTLWRREVTIYADLTGKQLVKPYTIRWIITKSVETEDEKAKGDGTMQFRFHPDLKPYLAVLKENFTRHTLEKIAGMSSLHAIRLYELFLDWGQNFQYQSKEVEIAHLKKILMLEDQYTVLNNFKARVLDPSIAQINEFTELNSGYGQRKTGRTVTHLIFTFAPKAAEKPAKAPKPSKTTQTTPKPVASPTAAKKRVKSANPAKQETTMTKPPEEGMVRCGNCGQSIRQEVRVCPHCSAAHVPVVNTAAIEGLKAAKAALGVGTSAVGPQPRKKANFTPDPVARARIEAELAKLQAAAA